MPKKSKAPTGEVVYSSKEVNTPEPPTIDIPIQGTDTSAPAPPPAPTPASTPAPVTAPASTPVEPPTVKAKRVYRKKNPQYWEAMTLSRKEMLMPPPKNEIIIPVEPKEPNKAPKSVKSVRKPITPVSTPIPSPAPTPVKKAVKIQAPKKKKKPVVYESSEEEEEEEEESESDEEIVERVAQKTHRRLSTLQKIDNRLKELKNPYSAVGRFSVF